ncbi:MAG: hypothetical protein QOE70_1633 [Chthoniobacter sp.]|nr:hypothetical protein [Chthoniobacter sp.]
MTRFRKSLLTIAALSVIAGVASISLYRSHRVASFAQQHLGLDLTVTPFGSSPTDIPGIKPYAAGGFYPKDRALVWYSGPENTIYGFSDGRLAEIRVTRSAQANQSSARLNRFLYSISPKLFHTLRGSGELSFADSTVSLESMSYCDPLNPFWKTFTIKPNAQ